MENDKNCRASVVCIFSQENITSIFIVTIIVVLMSRATAEQLPKNLEAPSHNFGSEILLALYTYIIFIKFTLICIVV